MLRMALTFGFYATTLFTKLILAWPVDQVVLSPDSGFEADNSPLKDVREALTAAQVIPTVIDDFEPSFLLGIQWEQQAASLGNTLEVSAVKKQPKVSLTLSGSSALHSGGSNMTYIITLTDPDAPSRTDPKWSEMCHFIATGLALSPTTDSGCLDLQISDLKDIMPYKPPGPPPKTGKHRYVFLVFGPANGTTEPLYPSKPADRQHWGTDREGHGVRDWAAENGLAPVAANFIYAQNKKQ